MPTSLFQIIEVKIAKPTANIIDVAAPNPVITQAGMLAKKAFNPSTP